MSLSEKLLQQIVDKFPAHIYWTDKNTKIIGANLTQAINFGCKDVKSCIGKDTYDFAKILGWDKETADSLHREHMDIINSGVGKVVENSFKLADNTEHTYLSYKYPLVANGKTTGLMGISVDITDRKKAEEELIKTKAAKEAAEFANKAKTEFLENMRHDMRTALSGIQSFSELISDIMHEEQIRGDDSNNGKNKKIKATAKNDCVVCNDHLNNTAKIYEYADSLVASCRALTHIHKQILHAIYAFSGDIPSVVSKFNAEGKIKEIVNLHLAVAAEKGIQLQFKCDKTIPKYLAGDCRRLSAIALELVANAFKYTNKGKVLIGIAKEGKRDGKVILKFSVQDTGIGIPEDRKSEIFTRFGRVNPSYEGKYIGLGLGLSVVKQFVTDIGGEIYVDSKLNEGSTFTCYLPFGESLSKDNKNVDEGFSLPLPDMEIGTIPIRPVLRARATTATSTQEAIAKKTAAILQVEDEEICISITGAMLKKFGFTVDVARTGKEALQKYQEKEYDLILMDVGLPDLSGIEVTRKIRINEKTVDKHTPIVALTAHVDKENKQQCVEAGMDAVLSKPIVGNQFSEILNAFLPNYAKETQLTTEKIKSKKPAKKDDRDLLQINSFILDFDAMKKNNGFSEEDTKKFLKNMAYPSLRKNMQILEDTYNKKDWEMVQNMAHKISGACSSCCLIRMWDACKRLEIYIMEKKTKIRDELCKQVFKEYKSVQDVVEKF